MSAGVVEFSPWQLFLMGGPLLVPIVICSFFALTIVIQKIDHFRSFDVQIRLLKDRVMAQVNLNNIKGAILACDASGAWGAPVLKAGLMKFGGSRQEIMEAMDDAARLEVPKLEKGLVILSTIASITPLLGLLGTVLGLCGAFHIIQVRAAAMNPVGPGDIAGGIWQALVTTVVSLLVAIPVFVAYNYFVNKIHLLVRDMEKVSLHLVDRMTRVSGPEISGKE
jgi:biopolymer transport protein ExbB